MTPKDPRSAFEGVDREAYLNWLRRGQQTLNAAEKNRLRHMELPKTIADFRTNLKEVLSADAPTFGIMEHIRGRVQALQGSFEKERDERIEKTLSSFESFEKGRHKRQVREKGEMYGRRILKYTCTSVDKHDIETKIERQIVIGENVPEMIDIAEQYLEGLPSPPEDLRLLITAAQYSRGKIRVEEARSILQKGLDLSRAHEPKAYYKTYNRPYYKLRNAILKLSITADQKNFVGIFDEFWSEYLGRPLPTSQDEKTSHLAEAKKLLSTLFEYIPEHPTLYSMAKRCIHDMTRTHPEWENSPDHMSLEYHAAKIAIDIGVDKKQAEKILSGLVHQTRTGHDLSRVVEYCRKVPGLHEKIEEQVTNTKDLPQLIRLRYHLGKDPSKLVKKAMKAYRRYLNEKHHFRQVDLTYIDLMIARAEIGEDASHMLVELADNLYPDAERRYRPQDRTLITQGLLRAPIVNTWIEAIGGKPASFFWQFRSDEASVFDEEDINTKLIKGASAEHFKEGMMNQWNQEYDEELQHHHPSRDILLFKHRLTNLHLQEDIDNRLTECNHQERLGILQAVMECEAFDMLSEDRRTREYNMGYYRDMRTQSYLSPPFFNQQSLILWRDLEFTISHSDRIQEMVEQGTISGQTIPQELPEARAKRYQLIAFLYLGNDLSLMDAYLDAYIEYPYLSECLHNLFLKGNAHSSVAELDPSARTFILELIELIKELGPSAIHLFQPELGKLIIPMFQKGTGNEEFAQRTKRIFAIIREPQNPIRRLLQSIEEDKKRPYTQRKWKWDDDFQHVSTTLFGILWNLPNPEELAERYAGDVGYYRLEKKIQGSKYLRLIAENLHAVPEEHRMAVFEMIPDYHNEWLNELFSHHDISYLFRDRGSREAVQKKFQGVLRCAAELCSSEDEETRRTFSRLAGIFTRKDGPKQRKTSLLLKALSLPNSAQHAKIIIQGWHSFNETDYQNVLHELFKCPLNIRDIDDAKILLLHKSREGLSEIGSALKHNWELTQSRFAILHPRSCAVAIEQYPDEDRVENILAATSTSGLAIVAPLVQVNDEVISPAQKLQIYTAALEHHQWTENTGHLLQDGIMDRIAECPELYEDQQFLEILGKIGKGDEKAAAVMHSFLRLIDRFGIGTDQYAQAIDIAVRTKSKPYFTNELIYMYNGDIDRCTELLTIYERNTEAGDAVMPYFTAAKGQPIGDEIVAFTRAVQLYTDLHVYDELVYGKCLIRWEEEGHEAADEYVNAIKDMAKQLVGSSLPSDEIRKAEEYAFLIRYVYPKGDYSNHEKNAECGDRLEHLERYQFDRSGYATQMTGLLGYTLKEGSEEDLDELQRYQNRLNGMKTFIETHGPNADAIQQAFDAHVDQLFESEADEAFTALEGLNTKEKMLCLFLSEVMHRKKNPRPEILDLIVLYKYSYEEDLEAYIQQTADTAQRQKDAVSQHYVLWNELSSIYGENLKHILQHSIFDKLLEESEHYETIVAVVQEVQSEKKESGERGLKAREKGLSSIKENIGEHINGYQAAIGIAIMKLDKDCPEVLQELNTIFKMLEETTTWTGVKPPLEHQEQTIAEALWKANDILNDKKVLDKKTLQAIAEQMKAGGADVTTKPKTLAQAIFAPEAISSFKNLAREAKQRGLLVESQTDKQQKRFRQLIANTKMPSAKKREAIRTTAHHVFFSNLNLNEEEQTELNEQIDTHLEAVEDPIEWKAFEEHTFAPLQKLSLLYRSQMKQRLEAMFSSDINRIFTELEKYEEQLEEEMKETRIGGTRHKSVIKSSKARDIRGFYTKTKETANARMGAYICLAGDKEMYENPNYFEFVLQDEETGKCRGLTMHLHVEATDGKKYLFFGPNPNESFINQISAEQCFDFMYEQACTFAEENGYDGIFVPSNEGSILGSCTNRGGNFPGFIKAKRIRNKKGELRIVEFGKSHILGKHNGSPYTYRDGALIWEKTSA